MIGQWWSRRQESPAQVGIQPLTPADAGRLDLGWRSMFTAEELRDHLARHPARSFWAPASGDYVIGGDWRHRREMASLVELGARGEARRPLIEALLGAAAAEGCPLVIFSDSSELRQTRWYADLGFELIQEIIVYELNGAAAPEAGPTQLRFERVTETTEELLAVDHGAFPYLWWNSPQEFEHYFDHGGVRLYLGREADGQAVAYAGITLYHGWGHLDRLAVLADRQGRGYGREMLAHAVGQVRASGARRTGLSTQIDNHRSQVLYERFGFRRTFRTDYRIYGHWLVADEAARAAVLSEPGGDRS